MENSTTTLIEKEMGIRRFYLTGIPRRRISTIKTLFVDKSFPPSAIINIEFLSDRIIECVVSASHTEIFLQKCKFISVVGIVLVVKDPTSLLTQAGLESLAQRLQMVTQRNTAPMRVRSFYSAWEQSLGLIPVAPTPETSHL